MSKEIKAAEDNARIFGILSLVFCFIPLVGLVLGIIATQKGRNGKSSFAVTTGWIGIVLSITIAVVVGVWRYNVIRDNEKSAHATARYNECVRKANIVPAPSSVNDPQIQALDKNYRDTYYNPGGGRDLSLQLCEEK